MFYFDPTYILVLIGFIISMFASSYVQSTYNKYDQVETSRQISGQQAARWILDGARLNYVSVEAIQGNLTDHYSPHEKILRLSDATRKSRSVAAIGVAAHEAGHAIQDAENYIPMRLRGAIVPIVNIAQSASVPILLIGMLFSFNQTLINIGILLFAATFIFQLITLPVEFNASKRAMHIIESEQILVGEEVDQARKVLRAAAMTYVAGAIASFLTVLRLVLLFGGGRRR